MNMNQIIFAPIFPIGVILILLFLGWIFAIIQFWMIRKRLGSGRAILLSFLRLMALSLLICFGLNPSQLMKREQKIVPTVAILLDTSQSMGLPGHPGKKSRLDEAKTLLLGGEKPLLTSLKEGFEVKLYAFGESLRELDLEELKDIKPEGRRGDLNEALEKSSGRNSFYLLLSDGNLNWRKLDSKVPPIVSFPLGDPKDYKDILIQQVKAPAMAFRERPVQIDVRIKSYGYSGLTLPVVLKDGNKLIAAKNIQMSKNLEEVSTSFTFTPEEIGQHHLSLSLPPQFGENLTSNNHTHFSLKVFRDKIRVLMVSGSPSMNYRFMRAAFKNDPSIDLLSFIILRTPTNIINVPLHEQSLIPFPVETIFSPKELKTFDLVVFDNFLYRPYLSPHQLENIREFVRGGGGFVMIGGPNCFGEGGYAGTPIEEILPVRFSRREGYRRDTPIGVKLNRSGINHPITRYSSDENDHLNLWREMPPLDGINLLEPKSSGTILLESSNGISSPILAVGQFGKGRVAILGTDYFWKWYMGMVAKGKGNWAYLRIMERMVRWLTKDPGLDPIEMNLPERRGETGREIEVSIRMKGEDSIHKQKGGISFSVFNPEGIKMGSQLKPSGQPGEYFGSFLPDKEGIYQLKVESPIGQVEESIVIAGLTQDLDGISNHEGLKEISSATGGKVIFNTTDLLKEAEAYREKSEKRFFEEEHLSLWGTPYLLGFLLALLGTEWYLRRKWGMI